MQTPLPLAAVALLAFLAMARADLALNPMFGDHMVLQRDRVLPVWGMADPGEKISVSFAGQIHSTTARADGKWMLFFDPMPVSNESRVLTAKGNNQIIVADVLVGDVWLGSGQSNMDFTVNGTDRKEAIKHMPEGTFDGIRLFIVDQASTDSPLHAVTGAVWKEPTTDNIMRFSATLFYFGEELHKRMPGVPLGLIRSSVGATNLYSWIPNEVRDKDRSAEYLRTWWGNATKSWTPEKQATRDQEKADYETQVADFKQRGEKLPGTLKKPDELIGPHWSRRPSSLYNGMIAPLQPMAIRGMIWYQGEWDCKSDWAKVYHDLFLAFAKSWRADWAKASGKASSGDFPIYIVQLPARDPSDDNGKYWPFLRDTERQLAADLPDSGYVVTFDTNDPTNMHPVEKSPVGQRLAWLALGKEYGQKLSWHGPELKSARTEAGGLLLEFDAGSEALPSTDGEPLRGFEIAGKDGVYHPAVAGIRGSNQVFVSSADVTKPKTVRYAFVPAPVKPNFHNSAGLPAGPFRTDQQPVPDGKH